MSTLDSGILLKITEELSKQGLLSGSYLDDDLLVGGKLDEAGRIISQASSNFILKFTKSRDIILTRYDLIIYHGASTLNLDDIIWLLTKVETLHSEVKNTSLMSKNCLLSYVEGEGSIKLDMSRVYVEMSITDIDLTDFIKKAQEAVEDLNSANYSRSLALDHMKLLLTDSLFKDDKILLRDLRDMLSKTVFTLSSRTRFWKVFNDVFSSSSKQRHANYTQIKDAVSHVFTIIEKYSE